MHHYLFAFMSKETIKGTVLMSKETYTYEKNQTNINTTLQKRHVHHYLFACMSKETYMHVKRGQHK